MRKLLPKELSDSVLEELGRLRLDSVGIKQKLQSISWVFSQSNNIPCEQLVVASLHSNKRSENPFVSYCSGLEVATANVGQTEEARLLNFFR